MRRQAPLALLGVLASLALAGCGGGDEAAPALTPADAAEALARAPERLREEGSFAFAAEFVETRRAGRASDERYLTLEGAIDLAAAQGRTVVDLTWLERELADLRRPGDPPPAGDSFSALFGEPVEVWWDERQAYLELAGTWRRVPRATLRTGLLGAAAEEPARLVELLPLAEDVRSEGGEEVDGEQTTHVSFAVDARRAGEGGVPAELHAAFRQALHGPLLRLEAWLDATGLPRRLAYTVSKHAVRSQGRVVIPAKTIRVRYDLSRFGDEGLETEPPAEARG